MSYEARAGVAQNPMARRLLETMARKKSNLSVAADVDLAEEVVALADKIGPHICCLKTHCDIHTDWSESVGERLRALADKHDFVIFEDRKFADIGNTVVMQVRGGGRPPPGAHVAVGPGGGGARVEDE